MSYRLVSHKTTWSLGHLVDGSPASKNNKFWLGTICLVSPTFGRGGDIHGEALETAGILEGTIQTHVNSEGPVRRVLFICLDSQKGRAMYIMYMLHII